MGIELGIFRTIWQAIRGPFVCEPKDRPILIGMWLLVFGAAGAIVGMRVWVANWTGLHFGIAFFCGLAAVGLIFFLGHWGNDILDVEDTFTSPLDQYEFESNTWSGDRDGLFGDPEVKEADRLNRERENQVSRNQFKS